MTNDRSPGSGKVLRLPDAQKVLGLHFDGRASVRFQYQSEHGVCEIRLSLTEVLRAEDWFIGLRRALAPMMAARKDALPEAPTP